MQRQGNKFIHSWRLVLKGWGFFNLNWCEVKLIEVSYFFCLIMMVLFSLSQLNLPYSAKPSKMAWVRTALLVKIDSSTTDPSLAKHLMSPAEVHLVWMNRNWSKHEIKCFPEPGSWHRKYFFLKTNCTMRKLLIQSPLKMTHGFVI